MQQASKLPTIGLWCRKRAGTLVVLALMAITLAGLLRFLGDARPIAELREAAQVRADAGKLPTEMQVRGTGLYWASVGNATLLALLLLTCRWWSRPIGDSRLSRGPAAGRLNRRSRVAFLFVLLAIVAAGGGLRWNLVSGSMWWDEAWAMQNVYHGEFEDFLHEEPLDFTDHTFNWERALWRYWSPLNHPVASVSSQAAHALGQSLGADSPHGFDEWVMRLPAFVIGLLAIVLVALTVARWGFPGAALVAAALLAVHPWAIRHTSEIRAYPFLFAGAAAALYSITCILQSRAGAWRGWIGFAFAQLLLVWSHVFALALALTFATTLLVAIFFAWPGRSDRFRAITRLAVVNLLAAGAFFQLFGPNIVQAISWADSFAKGDGNHLDPGALGRLCGLLGSGMPWNIGNASEVRQLVSMKSIFLARPMLSSLAAVVFAAAVVCGSRRLWHQFRPGAWLLLAFIAGALLTLALIWSSGSYFYPRFVLYLLIPLAIVFAIGATSLLSFGGEPVAFARKPLAKGLIAAAVLALYVMTVAPQLQVLNRTSIEPLREVAQGIRDFEEPGRSENKKLHVAGVGHGSERVRLYYPKLTSVRDLAVLERMIAKATAENAQLLVFAGHRYFNQASHPDLMAVIQDEARFEEINVYPGIKPDFFYRLYRFRGSPGETR